MRLRPTRSIGLERLVPWGFFALKVLVSAYSLGVFIPRYLRFTYMADGPARGLTAYNLAFGKFELFQTHQFQPLHIWVWAALLRVFGDIYWTGTALNVGAGAGTALFMYLLGRQLAGPAAGSVAALAFIFSPVHHNLTIAMGMAASLFFFWVAAGIYAAARAPAGGRGAVAAAFCLAAAALTRYEGALLLVLYSAYRLFRSRPRGVAAWSLWAAPLALAGVFLGHKLLLGTVRGFAGAWVFSALKADTADVLSNLHWYRRTYYGLERLWFDGRLVAVLGMFGAVMVWARRLRDEKRILIWAGPAALFVGLTAVAVFLGVGFAAERYFATILMLLFPFAGLAVVEVWRRAKGRPAKVAVAFALAAAAAYTAYFDAKDFETGLVEPWHWSQINDADLALKLRELWRRGELGPNEIIYMEENKDNFSNYAIQTYSNHPLNFFISPAWQTERDLWYLPHILKANDVRVAIFVNERSRHRMKSFYRALKKDAVIFEDPAHTVVVLREGWRRGVPDLSLKVSTDKSKVIR